MDLAHWSQEDYHVPLLRRLLLKIGAHPYRCAYCRVNFVSFRKRRERYRSHHRSEAESKHVSPAVRGS